MNRTIDQLTYIKTSSRPLFLFNQPGGIEEKADKFLDFLEEVKSKTNNPAIIGHMFPIAYLAGNKNLYVVDSLEKNVKVEASIKFPLNPDPKSIQKIIQDIYTGEIAPSIVDNIPDFDGFINVIIDHSNIPNYEIAAKRAAKIHPIEILYL